MTVFPIPIDESGNPRLAIDKLEDKTSLNFVYLILMKKEIENTFDLLLEASLTL